MRLLVAMVGCAALVLFAGCNNWPHLRDQQAKGPFNDGKLPAEAEVIAQLNDNARRVQSFECRSVDIDAKQGLQSFGLQGMLACEKPHGFRMVASALGSDEVDIGSNNQEFWYWLKRAEPKPYVFHCSYDDFNRGNIRYMPFPFQPDWIMEAFGIAEYDSAKKYILKPNGNALNMFEESVSPQGQKIWKVTVLKNGPNNRLQIAAHRIVDEKGKDICSAVVERSQVDPSTGAVLPQRVVLYWPQDKTELKMVLGKTRVGPVDGVHLFNREALNSLPAFDLARGQPDGPISPVQRVRGTAR
jgi:hypothetical protein